MGTAEHRKSVEYRLADISTVDLIDELSRRCSPSIIMGYKNEEDGPHTFFEYEGEPAVCYGLCHQLSFNIQKDMIQNELREV